MSLKKTIVLTILFSILFTPVILFLSLNSVSAAAFFNFDTSKNFNSSSTNSRVYGIDVDDSGNYYGTGQFNGTVDFDPDNIVAGDTVSQTSGNSDAVIVKYNSSGVLQWIQNPDRYGGEKIQVDSNSNVIVSGRYPSTVDFDVNNVVAGDTLTSNGGADAYLVKYNSSGVLQWAKSIGGTSGEITYSMTVDSSDNIYLSGDTSSASVDYDEDNVVAGDTVTLIGNTDSFVAKYNSSGVLQWVKTFGSVGDSVNTAGVAVDSSGNVFLGGYYEGTPDFETDAVIAGDTAANGGGDEDGYLVKYNSSGVFQWAKTLDGPGFNDVYALDTDSTGSVVITSGFENTIDFEPDAVIAGDTHTAAGSLDAYIAKYNSSGVFQWVKAIGGTGYEYGLALVIDENDNIYAGGDISTPAVVDFDEDNVISGDSKAGISDNAIYLVRYSPAGVLDYVNVYGEAGGYNSTITIAVKNNKLYMGGEYGAANIDFEPESVVSGDTISGGESFIAIFDAYSATRVENLAAGLGVVDTASSKDAESYDQDFVSGTRMLRIETSGGLAIGEVDTDMSADLDWSSVSAESNAGGLAYIHNLTTAPGTAANFTLYIPKVSGQEQVTICPGADELTDLVPSCPGAVIKTEADGDTSIVDIGGTDYWAVTGLTGTGGFGSGSENSSVYIDLDVQPATTPSTISTAPEVAVSTADEFYLSYIPNTTEFGIGDYIDVVIPFDWTGLATCASSTTDADGDTTGDGSMATVDSQIIRFTFSAVTTSALTTGVEVCFAATTVGVPGNYNIAVSDTNDGDYGPALIYVGDDNDVTLTATIPITLSLRIKEPTTTVDTNSCALGVLNPGSVNTCSYRIAAGTNISTGLQVFTFADNQLNTAGDAADIDDVAGGATVTAGVEEHGILVTLGTGWTVGGSFSVSTDEVMPLTETLILDAAASISDSDTATWNTIVHSASVNSGTEGGSYDQLVTYRAWVDT